MAREHGYALSLHWVGAARGPVQDYAGYDRAWVARIDGKPDLAGSADPLFRGDAGAHNPEDLLIAALASCHMLSVLAIAGRARIPVAGYVDEARGTMIFEGGGGRFTQVVLRPRLTLLPGTTLALDRLQEIHEEAHRDCFIAASVNFPVRVEPVQG